MCLAEFAATYIVNYEHNDCDALPAPEWCHNNTDRCIGKMNNNIANKKLLLGSGSTIERLILVIGMEPNACCIILGLMNKQIY